MASYTPYSMTLESNQYGSLAQVDFKTDGFMIYPQSSSVYKMLGKASGIWVSWTSNNADYAGSDYSGPGTLDIDTISVSSIIGV